MKELDLLVETVPTHLRYIDEVQHSCRKMCKCSDRCHFNGVSLFQWMIEDTRCIDHLPTDKLKVHVADKEGLCCKCIGLYIHICIRDDVHKGRLSHIGIASQNQRSGC